MNKGGSGVRRPKAGPRGHPPPGDFIALGNRGSRVPENELKPLQPLKPPQPPPSKKPGAVSLSERKRDSATPLTPLGASKRPKLSSPTYSSHSLKAGDGESSKRPGTTSQSPLLGQVTPIEVTASELEDQILDADASGNKSRVDGLLLGAIKNLKSNRAKPDSMMYMNLVYLAKSKPELFISKRVVEALTSILKREGGSLNIKPTKGSNAVVPMMACNILLYTYQEEEDWPESFVKVYVEDALGDRVWVDNEHCRSFVENIWTAFGTKTVPRSLARQHSDPLGKQGQLEQTAAGASQGAVAAKEEEEVVEEMETSSSLEEDCIPVIPRFTSPSVEHNVQTYILELVHDQLTRRQLLDSITRNLLKLLTVTCGYSQIRLLVSQRLEMWLQNPKLTRAAQELLMSLALNCNSHGNEDVEVISNLIRMRMKTKPLANHYVACIKELVNQHPENLGTLLKYVIYNELSTTRNPNNMSLLSTIFQSKQEKAAKLLAMVFQDLLTNKDDYLRASRALLREIVRALRHELDFVALCRGFMKERTESQFKDLDATLKDRLLLSLTNLICMAIFLNVTSSIKEVFSASARGEKKDLSVLREFHKTVSTIQRDAVWWLHVVVPKMFNPNGKDFLCCLNRVLFLEPVESYVGKDNWPAENDRSLLLSIISEVPVQEDTLMRSIIIGLSNELPLTAPETLEIADSLVRRAATVKMTPAWMQGDSALSVNRSELLDAVLNLCAYHHPKDIVLPLGYTAPKLAIANLYWKGWILLAIVASLNPSSIGESAWENFPMLNCLMEMLMTNNFTFPPPTAAVTSEGKDQILAQESQLEQAEKEEILEFEAHLAAATTGVNITEGNSLLLAQLISMDPVGPARRPPQNVIDQLKATNKTLKLGQMLCRSRSPDFLLDIIQRQGTSQSMPWLADLVQSSEGSLDVLPVQCLCEFLLLEKTGDSENEEEEEFGKELRDKRNIQKHVLGRLRYLLFGADADAESAVEILEYFMRRLSSVQTAERDSAVKGLELVLSQDAAPVEDNVTVVCDEEEGTALVTTVEEFSSPSFYTGSTLLNRYKWLLANLPTLPHFDSVRTTCCFALRQSCQVEIIPERLQAYLFFLANHATENHDEEFLAAAIDISQLIIERPTIMGAVLGVEAGGQETYHALLRLYHVALHAAVEAQERACSWREMPDQLFVQWSKDTEFAGKAATLHVMIIHAMIVLLTYEEPQGDTSLYNALLDAWCPERGHVKVYLTDTGDEAILLHEWLRLRMIRSRVARVVDAALNDLMPSQLLLFAQSFGIPVDSMSKLLQQLDIAAREDPVGIEEAVLDKGYMAQLVEVQQLRGAVGGDAFCYLLTEPPVKRESCDLASLDSGITSLPLADVQRPPLVKKTPMSVDDNEPKPQLVDAVLKIFMSPEALEPSQRRCIENRVQKILTTEIILAYRREISDVSEDSLAELLMEKLNEALSSVCGQSLVNGMFSKSAFSCSLLRLLMSRQRALKKREEKNCSLVKTIRKLYSYDLKGGPLSYAILQYRKQLRIAEKKTSGDGILDQLASAKDVDHVAHVRTFLSASRDRLVKPESITVEGAARACRRLEEVCSPLFEDFVKAIFTTLITENSHQTLGASSATWTPQQSLPLKTCAEILIETLRDSRSIPLSRDHLASGLFVDWSEIVDPEVVHVHPLLQRQLLFRDRASVPGWDRSLTNREERSPSGYLLGLLTHQASWDTMQDCLDWLLGQGDSWNSLNPTAALDFVWTCFHIPRLWQGRDQKSTAVGSQNTNSAVYEKPLLSLTSTQISSLTSLILLEVSSAVKDWCLRKGFDFKRFLEDVESGLDIVEKEKRESIEHFVSKLIGARLQLISLCCHGDKKKLQPAVNCLLNTNRWSKWLSAQFLVQLYLAQPSVMRWIKDFKSLLTSGTFSQSTRCQLDAMCHRIMTSLADSKPGKEYEDRAYNASLLLRKLACDHPMLVLRHLPMVAAQLRGRVHLKSKEFTNQQHLLVFSHVLGLLDLLRPHIFKHDKLIQEGLKDTLDAYFGLLQAGCLHNKELAAVVTKFMAFLHHFCSESPDRAFVVLQAKVSLLHDLLQDFPSLPSLQCVVSALSIQTNEPSTQPQESSVQGGASPAPSGVRAMITPPEQAAWTSSQLAPFVQRLSPGLPTDDVLKVLSDLDETSKRRVDILEHFVPHLIRLLADSTSGCRTQAHTLLLRHVRQNPSVAVKFVDTYMGCLNSAVPDVVSTAAKFLPEFIVLCSEYASVLLLKMFTLAVYDAHDVGVPLLQCIQLLNLD